MEKLPQFWTDLSGHLSHIVERTWPAIKSFCADFGWLSDFMGILIGFLTFVAILYKFVRSKLSTSQVNKFKKLNDFRYEFNKKMNSDAYLQWQLSFFKKVYSNSEFTNLYGKEYPATLIRSNKSHQYPFRSLCQLISTDVDSVEFDTTQKEYLKYLGDSVSRPKMKGFSVKEILLDSDGLLDVIHARATTYEQNLVTAHILEWELYKFYERKKGKYPNFAKDLKFRARYHGTDHPSLAILRPNKAYPLISVQALVIFKDYRDSTNIQWKAVVAQRSKNVSVKPDLWQIQPAGGFEVFGHEQDDNKVSLEQGFDIRAALLREYAEELFNVKEFIFCNDGSDTTSILTEEHVSKLIEFINRKTAYFDFLGIVTDLSVLRHEASFLIVIDDKECIINTKKSSEAVDLKAVSLAKLKDIFTNDKVHSSSAALLQLAIENDRLINLGISEQLK